MWCFVLKRPLCRDLCTPHGLNSIRSHRLDIKLVELASAKQTKLADFVQDSIPIVGESSCWSMQSRISCVRLIRPHP